MIIAAFLASLSLLYAIVSFAMNKVKTSLDTQYVNNGRSLSRVYSLMFENLMLQSVSDLDMYVNSDVVQNGSTSEIVEYIMAHKVWRPKNFTYVFYADASGTFYSDNGGTTQIADRDYFKEIMAGAKDSSVGQSVVARLSGRKVLHAARAVKNKEGKIHGIVGGAVPMSLVEEMFDAVKTDKNDAAKSGIFTAFIADSRMTNLLHTADAIVAEGDVSGILSDMDVHIIPVRSAEQGKALKSARLFVKKIANMNWYVGAVCSDSGFFAAFNTISHIKKIVFLVAALAGAVYYIVSVISIYQVERLRDEEFSSDPVTALLTLQALEKKAQEELDASKGPFVLIVADLNGFKFINKIYGESAGNEALCEFAAMLRMICRSYGGIAARGYADHFYYFAKLRTSIARFVEKFDWISENLSKASKDASHTFSPRYGISFAADKADKYTNGEKKTIMRLIGEASTAKKIAKTNTDKPYTIYNNEMESNIVHEQEIESLMRKALDNGEFFVVYQPKMALNTDKIIGAEALVRWNSPEMGLLPPNDFIPVFERNGFIRELDFAVYEMTFSFLRRLLDEGHAVVPISLNMSRCHTDPDVFITEFMKRFKKYDLPPNLIELEILERTVANEKPVLQEVTSGFQRLGFKVAMDDFGSGESSLNMLSTISVDTLKFDQNFLRANNDSEKLRIFITSLVQMAQKLQKGTVFEGVETEEQRDFLRSINCDSVQGYFYSKPLKEGDFIRFLEDHS